MPVNLLSVSIVEYVDNSYPGWIKAIFKDVNGREWSIVDKTVYFEGYESLDADTIYPKSAGVDCRITAECRDHENRKILTIEIGTNDGLTAENGETKFDIYSDQIEEKASD